MNNAGEIILPGAFVGAIPIREDITVLPSDGVRSIGWVVFEEVGVAVVNNYATDRIVVSDGAEDIMRKLGEYMKHHAR